MNIWTSIQAVVSYLTTCCTDDTRTIPRVTDVHARHSMPLLAPKMQDASTPAQPTGAITVYWVNELPAAPRLGRSSSAVELSIRALVLTPQRDATADGILHEIYAGDGTYAGLKAALQAFPAGQGFVLDLAEARPIEPEETTQGRFTAGLECRCVLRALR